MSDQASETRAIVAVVDGLLAHWHGGLAIPAILHDYVAGIRAVQRETFERYAAELAAAEERGRLAATAERIGDPELAAMRERVAKSRALISDLCEGRRDWILSIPVRSTDPDMTLAASLDDLERLADRFFELKRAYAVLANAPAGEPSAPMGPE